jgi:hypothetical protein
MQQKFVKVGATCKKNTNQMIENSVSFKHEEEKTNWNF